ncbi:hypothetical protein TNCV_1579851, partial [Trichonephila clavipes]
KPAADLGGCVYLTNWPTGPQLHHSCLGHLEEKGIPIPASR